VGLPNGSRCLIGEGNGWNDSPVGMRRKGAPAAMWAFRLGFL
jgi:hypothetical protein